MRFKTAFKRPFSPFWKTIIFGLLYNIPIISFISIGYLKRIIKATPKNIKTLPPASNILKMFVDGFLAFIIFVIWSLPAFILFAVFVKWSVDNINFAALTAMEEFLSLGPIILLILAVILSIIALYIFPVSFVLYSRENRFASAFKISKIFRKIFSIRYFGCWLLTVVILGLLNILFISIPLPAPHIILLLIQSVLIYFIYIIFLTIISQD